MKILYIEDNKEKYIDVCSALKSAGLSKVEWEQTVEKAIEAMRVAVDEGEPFDVIISDMEYPLSPGEPVDPEAGEKLVEKLKAADIEIPVIICSSHNYSVAGAYGSVFYSMRNRSWEQELVKMLKSIS